MTPVEMILEKLEGVEDRNGSGHIALCPAHDDKNPSLSISEGKDGQALIHCHAGCKKQDILEAAGLRWKDLYPVEMQNGHMKGRSWPIRNAAGKIVAVHHRVDKPDGKQVWWTRPDGSKGLDSMKTSQLPLYRSEKVSEWPDDVPVVVVEGEKAADALSNVCPAVVATVTGAESAPGPAALEVLRGSKVVLWPDNDEPGRKHMKRVAEALQNVASEVRVFEWTGAPDKGDAADHPAVKTKSRVGVEELLEAWAKAPVWESKLAAPPAPSPR